MPSGVLLLFDQLLRASHRLLAHLGVHANALNGFRLAMSDFLSGANLPGYVARALQLRPGALKNWKLSSFRDALRVPVLANVKSMGGEFLLGVAMLLIERQIVVVDASTGKTRNLFAEVFLPVDADGLAVHLRQQSRDKWLVVSTRMGVVQCIVFFLLHHA